MDEFTYTVKKILGKDDGHYEITKWGAQAPPVEQYDVIIPPPGSRNHLWCNCQGFRRQKYAKEKHKHILLVQEYQRQGEPEGRVYRIDGQRDQCTIVVVNESLMTADPLAFDESD